MGRLSISVHRYQAKSYLLCEHTAILRIDPRDSSTEAETR
jgi:hypothetical protein